MFVFSGTKTGDEFPCHAGSYNDKLGIDAWEKCEDCPPGYHCVQASINPVACTPYVSFQT